MRLTRASFWTLILLFTSILILSGCLVAMSSYQPEAFGRGKTFAVVSIAAAPEIGMQGAGAGSGGWTLSGLFKASSSDSGYSHNADRILAETVPVIIKEMEKSRHFRLAQGSWVLQHKAYRAAEGDDPKKFMVTSILPKGYKYFDTEQKLAGLAKGMNVDAVIIVHVSYSAAFSGVGAAGLVAAGTHSGKVTMSLSAIDRHGKVVWKDAVESTSDESIGSFGESANFAKLHPLLVDATRAASRKLLEKLNTKVAAL